MGEHAHGIRRTSLDQFQRCREVEGVQRLDAHRKAFHRALLDPRGHFHEIQTPEKRLETGQSHEKSLIVEVAFHPAALEDAPAFHLNQFAGYGSFTFKGGCDPPFTEEYVPEDEGRIQVGYHRSRRSCARYSSGSLPVKGSRSRQSYGTLAFFIAGSVAGRGDRMATGRWWSTTRRASPACTRFSSALRWVFNMEIEMVCI